jgi:hypothetical protein
MEMKVKRSKETVGMKMYITEGKPEEVILKLTVPEAAFIAGCIGPSSLRTVLDSGALFSASDRLRGQVGELRGTAIYDGLLKVIAEYDSKSKTRDLSTRLDHYMAKKYPDQFDDEELRGRIISSVCSGLFFGSDGCGGRSCTTCWGMDVTEIGLEKAKEAGL